MINNVPYLQPVNKYTNWIVNTIYLIDEIKVEDGTQLTES